MGVLVVPGRDVVGRQVRRHQMQVERALLRRSRAAVGTAVGYRANSAAISAPDRRCAPGPGGRNGSASSRLRRPRTAAIAAATRLDAGAA